MCPPYPSLNTSMFTTIYNLEIQPRQHWIGHFARLFSYLIQENKEEKKEKKIQS